MENTLYIERTVSIQNKKAMISMIDCYGYKYAQWNAMLKQFTTDLISQTAWPWKQQDQTRGSLYDNRETVKLMAESM